MIRLSNFNPEFDDYKKDGKIYIGKKMENEDGENYRMAEAICDYGNTYTEGKYDLEQQSLEFKISEKIKLFESPTGQQKYWCWLVETEDGNKTSGLHICRRTSKGNIYNEQEVTLNPHAISVLKQFLDEIKLCNNDLSYKIQTDNNDYEKVISNDEFMKLIEANINSIDDYYKLISLKKKENAVLELEKIIQGEYKNEVDIQKFLKKNLWLFGSEYYTFIKEEQINSKNILDGIPKNLDDYIDIIEVKLPTVDLFRYDTSHNNYYSSSELTKAIAQTQNYIFELEKMTVNDSYQNKNDCIIAKPRGIILIGSRNELNDSEKQYLRILNSSYHNIHIITYQQLLLRAKNMLSLSEEYAKID